MADRVSASESQHDAAAVSRAWSTLRGEFHLHRQTSITSELLEVMSGYELTRSGRRLSSTPPRS